MKKVVKGIDIYLEGKKQLVSGLQNELESCPNDRFVSLTSTLIDSLKTDVTFLETLKQKLPAENILKPTKSDCRHTKKIRDRDPEGTWYCMNCNENL